MFRTLGTTYTGAVVYYKIYIALLTYSKNLRFKLRYVNQDLLAKSQISYLTLQLYFSNNTKDFKRR